jgi:hypothetical protein
LTTPLGYLVIHIQRTINHFTSKTNLSSYNALPLPPPFVQSPPRAEEPEARAAVLIAGAADPVPVAIVEELEKGAATVSAGWVSAGASTKTVLVVNEQVELVACALSTAGALVTMAAAPLARTAVGLARLLV